MIGLFFIGVLKYGTHRFVESRVYKKHCVVKQFCPYGTVGEFVVVAEHSFRLLRKIVGYLNVFCAVLFCASANQAVFHLVFYKGGGIVRGTRAGGLEKRFKIAHIICAKPVDFWGKGAGGLFGVSRILARGFGGACHRLLLNEVAVFFVCGSLVSFHNLELEALPVVLRFLHVFGNSHVYESVWIFRKNFPQRLLSVGVRIGNLQFSVFKFHVPFSIYRHIRYPLPFRACERATGTTKWSFWKLVNYAIEGIIGFSTAPLRLATWLGGVTGVAAVIYLIVVVLQKLIQGIDVPGYATIIVLILLLGSVQLFCIGIIGEYVGRTFEQSKDRPIYIAKEVLDYEKN